MKTQARFAFFYLSGCFAAALLTGCAPHNQRLANSVQVATPTPVMSYENLTVKDREVIDVQTNRYSYIAAKPTPEQINPLLIVIDVRIPRDILTVEQTANYLLQRSGYQLSSAEAHNPKAQALLGQTLPDVHRHLGPMTLQDALLTLGGEAFRLMIDPVNRLLAYDINPNFQVAGSKP